MRVGANGGSGTVGIAGSVRRHAYKALLPVRILLYRIDRLFDGRQKLVALAVNKLFMCIEHGRRELVDIANLAIGLIGLQDLVHPVHGIGRLRVGLQVKTLPLHERHERHAVIEGCLLVGEEGLDGLKVLMPIQQVVFAIHQLL